MSKAVLVMDMPKNCCECKLQDWLTCRIAKKCNTSHSRPDWCPLKPMPEKKEIYGNNSYDLSYENSYADGYNACIDELLGEKHG